MWRYFIPAGAFLALGALLAFALMRIGAGKLDVHEIKSPLLGKSAPGFSLPAVAAAGQRVESSALAGQVYVLNVWGTWCAACRDEHEALLAIARGGRVPLIGIDWRDDPTLAVQYLAQLGNPYQQVGSDADGRVAINWGVYGAPETFLVSASGTVLAKHVGPLTDAIWQQEFVPQLKAAGR